MGELLAGINKVNYNQADLNALAGTTTFLLLASTSTDHIGMVRWVVRQVTCVCRHSQHVPICR